MISDILSESNLLLYAAKHYTNPSCFSTEEFQEDLNRLKYVKRLLNRFQETGELKERLILNHIIILYNVFGQPAATKMLFLKLQSQLHLLKPFLLLLNMLPDRVDGVNSETIFTNNIPVNQFIVDQLRNI